MTKRTHVQNPPATIPPRLATAIGKLHAVVEVMMVLRAQDQLGTIAEIIADQIDGHMFAVRQAMKGRR